MFLHWLQHYLYVDESTTYFTTFISERVETIQTSRCFLTSQNHSGKPSMETFKKYLCLSPSIISKQSDSHHTDNSYTVAAGKSSIQWAHCWCLTTTFIVTHGPNWYYTNINSCLFQQALTFKASFCPFWYLIHGNTKYVCVQDVPSWMRCDI